MVSWLAVRALLRAGLDPELEREPHAHGIGGGSDRGVHQDGIGAHLQRRSGVRRHAEAGIDHHLTKPADLATIEALMQSLSPSH